MNLYAYCHNNPVNGRDPMGLYFARGFEPDEFEPWMIAANVVNIDSSGEDEFWDSALNTLIGGDDFWLSALNQLGDLKECMKSYYDNLTSDNDGLGIGDILLEVVKKGWNGVNSVLGLALGGVGLLFGGDAPNLGHNAIEFTECPFMIGGLTLGNVILYPKGFGPNYVYNIPHNITLGDHEEQHTYQGEVLGPIYLPAHIIDKALHFSFVNGWLEAGPYSNPPRPWR